MTAHEIIEAARRACLTRPRPRVKLMLSARCEPAVLIGRVRHVAPSEAFLHLEDGEFTWHVPLSHVYEIKEVKRSRVSLP
jgi:hypothetical protein